MNVCRVYPNKLSQLKSSSFLLLFNELTKTYLGRQAKNCIRSSGCTWKATIWNFGKLSMMARIELWTIFVLAWLNSRMNCLQTTPMKTRWITYAKSRSLPNWLLASFWTSFECTIAFWCNSLMLLLSLGLVLTKSNANSWLLCQTQSYHPHNPNDNDENERDVPPCSGKGSTICV